MGHLERWSATLFDVQRQVEFKFNRLRIVRYRQNLLSVAAFHERTESNPVQNQSIAPIWPNLSRIVARSQDLPNAPGNALAFSRQRPIGPIGEAPRKVWLSVNLPPKLDPDEKLPISPFCGEFVPREVGLNANCYFGSSDIALPV
jgi:hypothetical protein